MTRSQKKMPSRTPGKTPSHRAPMAVALPSHEAKAHEKNAKTSRLPQAKAVKGLQIRETQDPFSFAESEARPATSRSRKSLSKGPAWGRLFLSTLGALLGVYAADGLITWIQTRIETGGPSSWLLLGLAAIAALSALGLLGSELFGLLRLKRLHALHEKAKRAASGEADTAHEVYVHLIEHFEKRADLAWPLARLREVDTNLIAPTELIALAERELMEPLDRRAHDLILMTARRVALLTALMPAPFLDLALVTWQLLRLVRDLSTLYGARPGWIGTFRLVRMALVHLAVTGTLALSDAVVQTFLGRGLAGRLSARFGEGVINGIMTARIGIAAMEIVRPLPFRVLPAPSWRSMAKALVRNNDRDTQRDETASNPKR